MSTSLLDKLDLVGSLSRINLQAKNTALLGIFSFHTLEIPCLCSHLLIPCQDKVYKWRATLPCELAFGVELGQIHILRWYQSLY